MTYLAIFLFFLSLTLLYWSNNEGADEGTTKIDKVLSAICFCASIILAIIFKL